jgi:hypothetical protein
VLRGGGRYLTAFGFLLIYKISLPTAHIVKGCEYSDM